MSLCCVLRPRRVLNSLLMLSQKYEYSYTQFSASIQPALVLTCYSMSFEVLIGRYVFQQIRG